MEKDLEGFKEKLNKISPSFCLAKWLQLTLHLQYGHTHSCHHPLSHRVPIEELKKNVSALHNTKLKKTQRKMMLMGIRPKECIYCWNIEDTPGNHVSDRHIKSSDPWAKPLLNKIKNLSWNKNVNPTFLEVSFSHKCNFKCSYCAPHVSSRWLEEIRQHGAYLTKNPIATRHNNLSWFEETGRIPIPENETNPYVEAFWKWWPKIRNDLKVLRVTGGEPLLSQDTFKLIDHLLTKPLPNLDFAINTNLGAPDQLIDKLLMKSHELINKKAIKEMTIYTSVDTWGEQAEYIRYGLNFNKFWQNINRVLKELPQAKLTIMCTYNALSVPKFKNLLEAVLRLRNDKHRVCLDISYLSYPDFLSVKILTPAEMEKSLKDLEFMEAHKLSPSQNGFLDYEIVKMKRLVEWMQQNNRSESWISEKRNYFSQFINEHDERRHTNFHKTFPEFKEFWSLCTSQPNPNTQASRNTLQPQVTT